jgi:hypothetical protein
MKTNAITIGNATYTRKQLNSLIRVLGKPIFIHTHSSSGLIIAKDNAVYLGCANISGAGRGIYIGASVKEASDTLKRYNIEYTLNK